MITFYESNNINTADVSLKLQIKKFLLEKYQLDKSILDQEDPISVDKFAEYHLDLYLLGF